MPSILPASLLLSGNFLPSVLSLGTCESLPIPTHLKFLPMRLTSLAPTDFLYLFRTSAPQLWQLLLLRHFEVVDSHLHPLCLSLVSPERYFPPVSSAGSLCLAFPNSTRSLPHWPPLQSSARSFFAGLHRTPYFIWMLRPSHGNGIFDLLTVCFGVS